jgi:hypothetical protein
MTTALVLTVLLAGAVAVVRRLDANHRRVTTWPRSDDASDRDAARVRADLTAARTHASAVQRPRLVHAATVGRRAAPPTPRAA